MDDKPEAQSAAAGANESPAQLARRKTDVITRDDEVKHIPVILCTTKNQETDKIWGLRQGARDYVVKPILASDLLDKMARIE